MKQRNLATLLVAALILVFAAPSFTQEVDDLRFRTGLESLLAQNQMIVRVTELEPDAAPSRVVVLFRNARGEVVRREVGRVSPAQPFETVLQANEVGSGLRELVRIDLRLTNRPSNGTQAINVDVFDPIGFSIEERVICNGQNAGAGGPIGNCEGILNFVPPR
jgi:hypothetical protein